MLTAQSAHTRWKAMALSVWLTRNSDAGYPEIAHLVRTAPLVMSAAVQADSLLLRVTVTSGSCVLAGSSMCETIWSRISVGRSMRLVLWEMEWIGAGGRTGGVASE